ncbi:MAG: hypothetical protein IJW49_11495 [Clostridia bacterium]|nr:hypothetical protein [Clostridia bacterium]
MKAQEFWKAFFEKVEQHREELEECWDESSRFTEKISAIITNVIKGVKPSNEFIVQPEYYNIDITEWEQKKNKTKEYLSVIDGDKGYRFERYAWNFDIAVEHENDKNLWMDEVIKLAYIFCDLRVVIGYFPYIEEADKKIEMQQKYLDAISETIKTLKCRDNMKHGKFMIILGDVGGKKSNGFKKLVYTPYRYNPDEEKFELLKK